MKIIVKHLETQIEISDSDITNDGRGLLYHNNTFSLQLLEKVVNEVIRLNENKEEQ